MDFKKLIEEVKEKMAGVGTLADKLSSIAEKIDGITYGLGSALKTNIEGAAVASKIQEVELAAVKMTNIFGQGREHILAIKAGLVDSVAEVTRLGGSFQDIVDMQENIAKATGRNVIINSEVYEKLYATNKVMGTTTDQLTKGFEEVGFSVGHISGEMQKVLDVSRSMGLNAKDVSKDMLQNLDYMNRFNFQGGVEGMAKMAAQAVNLRVSMKDTLQFAERVYNPENAIETAAALQRLGVTQSELLDPLRLMDLSLNDPTELQNQISEMTKQFVAMNEKGQFEILPDGKLQLYEIARAMQIPYDTLTDMALNGAKLSEKMSQIRFPKFEEFADEKTRTMIANMAEFNEKTQEFEISYVDKDGKPVTKAVTELNPEDIKALEKAAQPKDMTDIAKQQLDIETAILKEVESIKNRTGYAYAASPMAEKIMTANLEVMKELVGTIDKKFDIKNLRQQFGKTSEGVLETMKTGDFEPMKKALSELQDYFASGITDTVSVGWPKALENLRNSSNEVVRFFTDMNVDLEELLKELEIFFPETEEGKKTPAETEKSEKPAETEKSEKPAETEKSEKPAKTEKDDTENQDVIIKRKQTENTFIEPKINTNTKKLLDENIFKGFDLENFIKSFISVEPKSTSQVIKTEGETKLTLDINVNATPNLAKEEIMSYLERTEVIAQLKQSLNNYIAGFGKLSNSDNPITQALNNTNEAFKI